MRVRITPSPLRGEVSAPPSKSYTHRAVILASLAAGESVIEEPLLADDTRYTINACRSLGADIQHEGNKLMVSGSGGKISAAEGQRIFAGNSGSTIRMIAPVAALSQSRVVLDGDSRLRQRPMGDLLSALGGLGIHARSLGNNGYPPLEIKGGNFSGGEVTLGGEVSSQHISALLMVAPCTKEGIKIKIAGGLRSRPYIDITLDAMQAFGVEAVNKDYKQFLVKGGQEYKARQYRIEGDYSSAAYFFAAGAIGGQPLTVANLKNSSVQGDKHLLNILSEMGCSLEYQKEAVTLSRHRELKGVSLDMSDYPDLVPTVAVIAAYAHGKTEMSNIGRLRFKESDRLATTAAELSKMGIKSGVSDDSLVVYGGKPRGAETSAHNDHRLAMSLAVAALFAEGDSIINGAEAVTKSYPRFFADLASLKAKLEELS
ncbi:MAG TPA: 3-phosphoshikimate 1-carboxyvinyltransferase [Dehalococcoidia bacterium]|nr:3-phosphoshikimate 1-carboxyvinyltransferase [Dehalococcoidia bacterium]